MSLLPEKPAGNLFDRPVRSRTRDRLLVAVPVAAGHVALIAFAFSSAARLPNVAPPDPPPLMATLIPPPRLPPPKPADTPAPAAPAASTPAAAAPTPPKPTPPRPATTVLKPRPARTPPPEIEPLPAGPTGPTEPSVILGEAALAGATLAGSGQGAGGGDGAGGGGGQCDMVRRLQDALRSDAEVKAAVTQSHRALGPGGKAILVWDGEWLRSPGQDGKGLAGVRQAIAMEIAFAPDACKARPMRGLVVISFNDSPGAPRLALGSGSWRWSELLSARR